MKRFSASILFLSLVTTGFSQTANEVINKFITASGKGKVERYKNFAISADN